MRRFTRSLKLAFSGIAYAFRTERHMKVHAAAAVAAAALGFAFSISLAEWAVIVLAVTIVVTAEIVNTAIERVVDLASPDLHPAAKLAKDAAAGAVLVAAIGSLFIGLLVFGPHICSLWINKI
jgi:Diacylglycerol kinase